MTKTRLYRATDDKRYTGQWSCWTAELETAEAYTDNPGFGGQILLAADINAEYVLDLSRERDPLRALADALYDDEDEAYEAWERWTGAGYGYVYDAWQERQDVADLLAESYDWVVYEDDYPDGAITWTYLGSTPIDATEMAEA